jgi:hypothetical protein
MSLLDMAFGFTFLKRARKPGFFYNMPGEVSASITSTGPHERLLGPRNSFTIAAMSTAFSGCFKGSQKRNSSLISFRSI